MLAMKGEAETPMVQCVHFQMEIMIRSDLDNTIALYIPLIRATQEPES